MNGQPLPHFNGFPARVILPGWTATYWVKHVTSITAITKPFEGFWMKSAYRIPLGRFPLLARFPSQDTDVNTPITEMVVNSLITSHDDGSDVKAGAPLTVGGVAWDAGYGIRGVELLHRRRPHLDRSPARRGPRPLRVPAVQLPASRQPRASSR